MREEKNLLKQEFQRKIERYDSFVIMQYGKVKANTANAFRRQVGKEGGDVEVGRKTVLVKAFKDAGIELDINTLTGHVGVVFLGQDPLEMTKMVIKFGQSNDKIFTMLGGRFDGQYYQGADVEKLATLPSKNEMRAQLLSIFEAPLSQTLAVMDAILTSVPHCLENKAKQSDESQTDETISAESAS
jgi:large subunit ribosomal protein L10